MAKLYYDQVPFDAGYNVASNNFAVASESFAKLQDRVPGVASILGGNTSPFTAKFKAATLGAAYQDTAEQAASESGGLLDKIKKTLFADPNDPTRTQAETDAQADGTWLGDMLEEFFVRAAVIILGFVFVAAGLAMFKSNAPIINVVKGAVNG